MSLDKVYVSQIPAITETQALLQDDAMKLRQVADKQQPGGKPIEGQHAPADGANAKPTASEAMYVAAFKEFDASHDKKAAMVKLGPQFEKAVTQADVDYEKTKTDSVDKLMKAIPRLAQMEQSMADHVDKAATAIEKIPDRKVQQAVANDLEGFLGTDPKSARGQQLAKNLGQYPGLLEAANGILGDKKDADALSAELADLDKQGKRAEVDRIGTRRGYADALEQSGDKVKAADYRDQADALLDDIRSRQPEPDHGHKAYPLPTAPILRPHGKFKI